MIPFFEVVLAFSALMMFPLYLYWVWEVVVFVKKLFS